MIEPNLERLRAHRANIGRYRRLLATRLSDLERAYIKRRLNEEQASVEALVQETFRDRFSFRTDRGRPTNLDVAALLHPAQAYAHPMDVVEDCDLTSYEKRAILSSWAADACAVKYLPESDRTSDEAGKFDDILDALRLLDADLDSKSDDGPKSEQYGTPDSGDTPSL